MATEAQKRKLREAVEQHGGRLRASGMMDQSLASMFNEGLIEARAIVDEADLLRQVQEHVDGAADILAKDRTMWRAAYRALKDAEEFREKVETLQRFAQRRAGPAGRPLDRWEILRFSGVVGVFVTPAGRALLGLPQEPAPAAPSPAGEA